MLTFGLVILSLPVFGQHTGTVFGRVVSADGEEVPYATVFLKGTTRGTVTDDKGSFRFQVPTGVQTLVVSSVGHKQNERQITVRADQETEVNFAPEKEALVGEEVVVRAQGGVSRVNKSAYNAVAVDTKALQNSTKNLSQAIAQAPGMKIRESGGVGSDMQLLMDGFSGKHIKIFIDGVPQEGVGSSFGLNNIPVNYAERIEIYRGVVPVGFGADALGGVINIVTNKKRSGWNLDASYAYGSFNTHKSHINFNYTLGSGWMFEVNAFQNYSDNNYWIDTPVEHFNADGSTSLNTSKIEHVRRFHDTYHNEAAVAKVGMVNRSWADRLLLGFAYSQMYKEIQNGVIQKVVFGQKFRRGHSLMPSLEYSKQNLLTEGLTLSMTANYNDNTVRNVDTSAYRYNWLGEKKYMSGSLGEQVYQDLESKNRNWNGTVTLRYRLGERHLFLLNHVTNNFRRDNTSRVGGTTVSEADAIAKITRKNISGLSYQYIPSEAWNISLFGKYYNQYNAGPVSTSASGADNYVPLSNSVSAFGYGAAATYLMKNGLQAKLSYERAYRLPTNEELFGDEDLELGSVGLKPERSDNLNLSLSFDRQFAGIHGLYAEVGFVYRNMKDYIQRTISTYSGNKTYASYSNHGKVLTKGFNLALRYTFADWISVGGNFTRMDVRDNVKTMMAGSSQASLTYGARMPNQPYMYAGSDISFFWRDLLKKGNRLTVTYDNFYVHSFPLYAENLGDATSKERVPSQFSHNISLTYSLLQGRYNFTFECTNFTNEKLYDNFSLQKAGRAFYGKVRIHFSGTEQADKRDRGHKHRSDRR